MQLRFWRCWCIEVVVVVVNDLQLKIKGSVYDSQIKGNLFVKFRMVSEFDSNSVVWHDGLNTADGNSWVMANNVVFWPGKFHCMNQMIVFHGIISQMEEIFDIMGNAASIGVAVTLKTLMLWPKSLSQAVFWNLAYTIGIFWNLDGSYFVIHCCLFARLVLFFWPCYWICSICFCAFLHNSK